MTSESVFSAAARFEEQIRRRNRRELVAAGFVAVAFAAFAVVAHSTSQRLTAVAVVVAALLVSAFIARFGAIRVVRGEPTPARESLSRELRRQARLLRWVPAWYAGPPLVGLVAFAAVRPRPVVGVVTALVVGVAVTVVNRVGASALDRSADELDNASAAS